MKPQWHCVLFIKDFTALKTGSEFANPLTFTGWWHAMDNVLNQLLGLLRNNNFIGLSFRFEVACQIDGSTQCIVLKTIFGAKLPTLHMPLCMPIRRLEAQQFHWPSIALKFIASRIASAIQTQAVASLTLPRLSASPKNTIRESPMTLSRVPPKRKIISVSG